MIVIRKVIRLRRPARIRHRLSDLYDLFVPAKPTNPARCHFARLRTRLSDVTLTQSHAIVP